MTERDKEKSAPCRPPLARRSMAQISPLPPPDEVFVDWLLSLPYAANIEAAARRQIQIIDQCALLHPDVQCLRLLLVAVAGDGQWPQSVPKL